MVIKGNDICNTFSTVPGKLFLPCGDDDIVMKESLYVKDCYPDQG